MFSCYLGATGYVCACPPQYTGKRCEVQINGIMKDEFRF